MLVEFGHLHMRVHFLNIGVTKNYTHDITEDDLNNVKFAFNEKSILGLGYGTLYVFLDDHQIFQVYFAGTTGYDLTTQDWLS